MRALSVVFLWVGACTQDQGADLAPIAPIESRPESSLLSLRDWGRADHRAAGPRGGMRAVEGVEGTSLTRAEGAVREWWTPRPQGLQVRWQLDAPPEGFGPVELRLGGHADDVMVDEDRLGARVKDGDRTWSIFDLAAWDANGDAVGVWFDEDDGLMVVVDVASHPWPIMVDPVITDVVRMTALGDLQHAVLHDHNNDGLLDFYKLVDDSVAVYHLLDSAGTLSTSFNVYRDPNAVDWGTGGDLQMFTSNGRLDMLVGQSDYQVRNGGAFDTRVTHLTDVDGATGDFLVVDTASAQTGTAEEIEPCDVNGDGFPDAWVHEEVGGNRWSLYLASPTSIGGARVLQSDAFDLMCVGDVDHDGDDDWVEYAVNPPTARQNRGEVKLFPGSPTFLTGVSMWSARGAVDDERLGKVMAKGDINGDGLTDLVLGTPEVGAGTEDDGHFEVYPGTPSGFSNTSQSIGAYSYTPTAGFSKALDVADYNGDGYDDVFVIWQHQGNTSVELFFGSASGVDPETYVRLYQTSSTVDLQVEGVDMNGDGMGDFVLYWPTDPPTLHLQAFDEDDDGVSASFDCNDQDASTTVFTFQFRDRDGDGHGDAASTALQCGAQSGWSTDTLDCDDTAATVWEGAPEIPNNRVDEDCNGREACTVDSDADGHLGVGPAANTVSSRDLDCTDAGETPPGLPLDDCDDDDNSIYGGATEVFANGVDDDCDGGENCGVDVDGDGVRGAGGVVSADADCRDPGEALARVPAGDCDDADAAVGDGYDYYPDQDGDGVGILGGTLHACTPPVGFGLGTNDCDDADPTSYPGAVELIGNNNDEDCDGFERCYRDRDEDGFISTPPETKRADRPDCSGPAEAPEGAPGGDCDDTVASIYPGATEVVGDGIDQSCDGAERCGVDLDGDGARGVGEVTSADADCSDPGEALLSAPAGDCDDNDALLGAPPTWWPDADHDSFGATTGGIAACEAPTGYLADSGDCADADPARHPGATETTGDGVDQDCDGRELCLRDLDDDGYLSASPITLSSTRLDCSGATEALSTAPRGDCNDTVASVNPGAVEVVDDQTDSDCNAQELCYGDADADGYGDGVTTVVSADLDCTDAGELRRSANQSDCAPLDAAIHPNAADVIADGIDSDCTGLERCYLDADRDGYRTTTISTETVLDCSRPGVALATVPSGDCNDNRADVNPGAEEVPADGLDSDCVTGDLCFIDADRDGYALPGQFAPGNLLCVNVGLAGRSLGADCDDDDATVNPGEADVVADGVDGNCDGIEGCYSDVDADGFRTDVTASNDGDCADPGEALESSPGGDCDDADSRVWPGAVDPPEDSVNQDCSAPVTCLRDADGDGWAAETILSVNVGCDGPGELPADTTRVGDCDDGDAVVFPTAPEGIGDGVDADCDGIELCWTDADADGVVRDGIATVTSADADCADPGEGASTTPVGDCDDGDARVSNLQREECDGVDQNCNGMVDEGACVAASGCSHADGVGGPSRWWGLAAAALWVRRLSRRAPGLS